jgi:hypothetical protein
MPQHEQARSGPPGGCGDHPHRFLLSCFLVVRGSWGWAGYQCVVTSTGILRASQVG